MWRVWTIDQSGCSCTVSMEQSYSAGVGQEVRADGLDVAASGSRELADSLEVLVGRPAGREGRQSLVDLRY